MNTHPRDSRQRRVLNQFRLSNLRQPTVVLLAIIGLLAATSACGGQASSNDDSEQSAATSVSSQLPDSIQTAGVLKFGMDISFPPMEFYVGETPTGFDVDLGEAIAQKLGVKAEFVNTSYGGIIPALQTRRFDVLLSSMTDTKERENVLNFVDYLNVGSTLLVAKGNPKGLGAIATTCGFTMAGQTGANASRIAHEQADKCAQEGQPALTVLDYPDQAQVLLAIKSGRADAAALDYTGAVGFVQQDGGETLAVASEQQENTAPYGIGFLKSDEQLMNAVRSAFQEIIADGQYASLLEKWKINAASLTTAAINGAVS